MSGTIAELGIAVDSGDAAQAATDLDKLTAAGVKAEKAADGVSAGFEKAGDSARKQRQELDSLLGKIDPLTKKLNDLAAQEQQLSQARKSGLIGDGAYDAYQQKIEESLNSLLGLNTAQKASGESAAEAKARIQQLVVTHQSLADTVAQGASAVAAADVITRKSTDSAFAEIGVISQLEKAFSGNIESIESLIQAEGLLEKARKLGLVTSEEQATYQDLLGKSYDKIEKAEAKELAQKQRLIEAEERQTEALKRTVNGIDPLTAKLAKLEAQERALNQLFETGHVDADRYAEALAKIGKDRAGLSEATGAFDSLKLGTRQAQENVVQLGNAISTGDWGSGVRAIAQIGATAGASALRLAAVVAPLALVATGVIGLVVAYEKGSAEAEEYNKQLVLTGNYAGTSAAQLADVARQVSATVGTTGAAASALAQLAGTGKLASGGFQEIAEAALEMEKATGKSVESTIAEFVKIADDPVAAAKSLNDQYHFLTASVYSQIVALKEQGDTIGATKLLTDTYAETVSTRAGEITKNLGLIERGWNAIKGAAAGALDATLNVGREQTLEQQIAILQKRINTPSSYDAIPIIGEDNPDLTKTGSTKEQDQSRLNFLLLQRDAEASRTKYVGDRVKAEQDSIEAMGKVDALAKSSWTNEQKRVEAVKEYKKWLDDIRKTDPNDSRLNQATVDKNIANINDKFKDPNGQANQLNLTGFNDAQNQLKSVIGYYQNIEKELDTAQKAGLVSAESYSSQRIAIVEQEKGDVSAAYQAEISALETLRDKSSTTAQQRIQIDQKIADAKAESVKAQEASNSRLQALAIEEDGRVKKQKYNIDQYVQALGQQQKALELAGQRAVLGVGRGDRQNALDSQLNAQQDRFAQQALDLENQRSDPSRNMSTEEFEQKSKALADANKKATDQIRQNYADVQTAQGDWTNGATSAWENYLDSAKDVAGQTKTLFTNAFSNMEDAVANFALTGKLSFSDFTKSVISDLARIATRQATSGVLSTLFGIGATAAGSYSGGAATGSGASSGFDYSLGSASSGLSYGGGRATGGDVAPNSLYQVNELGPELFSQGGKSYLMTGADGGSVTPLGSGAASVSAGAGGSSPIAVSIQINGDGNSQVSSNTSGMEQFGAEIGRFVEARYKQLEAKSLGPQGNIRKAINGRA